MVKTTSPVSRKLPAIASAMRSLPEEMWHKQEFDALEPYSPDDYHFSRYSSGPFGPKTAGNWIPADRAQEWLGAVRKKSIKFNEPFWYDVHAQRDSFSH